MAAATVQEYLANLPEDRREALQAVRKVILANLDKDFEEGIQYGMIGYYVPHRVFPAGYHCDPKQPLPFAAVGAQKNHMSLHLMFIYGHAEQEQLFQDAWAKTGKKLDMGKACVRFKKLSDLPLDVIGAAFKRVSTKKYLEHYQQAVDTRSAAKSATKAAEKPTTAKAAATKAPAAKKAAAKKAPVAKKTAAKKTSK
jgi:hypothetical protein